MERNRTPDRTDYDALRGYAGPRRAPDQPDEDAADARGPRPTLLDRFVMGAAYGVQWLRSRWSSKHVGRS